MLNKCERQPALAQAMVAPGLAEQAECHPGRASEASWDIHEQIKPRIASFASLL